MFKYIKGIDKINLVDLFVYLKTFARVHKCISSNIMDMNLIETVTVINQNQNYFVLKKQIIWYLIDFTHIGLIEYDKWWQVVSGGRSLNIKNIDSSFLMLKIIWLIKNV